jgi:uncharacterized protein (DUF1800 family)
MIGDDEIIAMTRFGCGISPGQYDEVKGRARDWVLSQLERQSATPVSFAGFLPFRERLDSFSIKRGPENKTDADLEERRIRRWKANVRIAEARIEAAVDTKQPLHERLVHFWFDHFTVSSLVGGLSGAADLYENEAIRPHIFGNFRDMLGAVTKHPLMLVYLDNVVSVGPNSSYGQERGKGLNENLARELMELHTLGVDGGYTQADVRALAKILTGWTVTPIEHADPIQLRFLANRHEPGEKLLLGRTIPEGGQAELETALDMLASSPKTARHIARKLAAHFIADDPPENVVSVIEQRFIETGGDLKAVTRALIEHPASWNPDARKVLLPEDWSVALARLAGMDGARAAPILQTATTSLGQRVYGAPSPKGWPDSVGAWLTPETVIARASWALKIMEEWSVETDPRLLVTSYGFVEGEDAVRAITGAPSRSDGLALIAASPRFNLR